MDLRTVVLFTMLFEFMFGVGMLVFSKQRTGFLGVNRIGFGFIVSATGFLLMFLRDSVSPFLSVVVCNTLILIGVILGLRGLSKLYEKKIYSWNIDIIALIVFFISYIYFLDIDPNINLRIIIICIYLEFYYIMYFYIIMHKPKFNINSVKWFIGSFLIIDIIFYLFRIIWTIFEGQITSFMDAGIVHSIGIVTFATLSLVISFGIFIIINSTIHEELFLKANIDTLTGLFNRRALSDIIPHQIKKSYEKNSQSTIAICDIDSFKNINDNYGHDVGDSLLKEIAFILEKNCRVNDFVMRYGGDEFVLILSQTDINSAKIACEKLRKLIQDKIFNIKNYEIKITLSIGLYTYPSYQNNWDQLISFADKALLKAKKNGRNQCCLYHNET